MNNRIITISREFGSGGRTIGRRTAAELGLPCYDAELIEKLEEENRTLQEQAWKYLETMRQMLKDIHP